MRPYLLYTETTTKSTKKLHVAEKDTKTPTHLSHSRQQGHLAWDSFYDPSEIGTFSLYFIKSIIIAK